MDKELKQFVKENGLGLATWEACTLYRMLEEQQEGKGYFDELEGRNVFITSISAKIRPVAINICEFRGLKCKVQSEPMADGRLAIHIWGQGDTDPIEEFDKAQDNYSDTKGL